MKQKPSEKPSAPESRRGFLRRGLTGTALFGLGSALGLWAPALAAPAATKPAGGGKLGPEYSYDVESLLKVDPKLVLFEEGEPLDPGLKEIRAVHFSSDRRLYVVGDRTVVSFSEEGKRETEIACQDLPRCVAEAGGNLYVGFKNRVEHYRDGRSVARWDELAGKPVLTALAASDKQVFAADAGNRTVWRFDAQGEPEGQIGGQKGSATRFIVPSPYFDLELGPGEILWIANPGQHRIEAYTLKGTLDTFWGEASLKLDGFCGCCNPVYFTRLPDGRFVTSEKGITRIKLYSAKGEFEGVVAAPQSFRQYGASAAAPGLDVAVDSRGRVWVADPLGKRLRVFTPKTKV